MFQLFHFKELYSINWISPLSVTDYQKEPYLFHSSPEITIINCLYTEVGIVGGVGGAALEEYIYSPPTKLREWFLVVCVCQSVCSLGGGGGRWCSCDHYPWCIVSYYTGSSIQDVPGPIPVQGHPGSAPPLRHVQTCSSWSMYGWQAGSGILVECFLVSWELGRANE